MIKAVFLDLGNTLIPMDCYSNIEQDVEYPFWKRKGYKGTLEQFKQLKAGTKVQFMKKAFRHSEDKHMWTKLIAMEALGCCPDDEIIADCWKLTKNYYVKKAKLRDGTLKLLEYLKLKKMKIALISNNWSDVASEAINYLDIRKYFHNIIISEDVGAVKSELKPFVVAIEKSALKPEECLMVGDDKEDSFSKNLGIHFVLLNAHSNNLNVDYDYKITDLLEVKKIVEGIA